MATVHHQKRLVVLPEREADARKMRELATEEGVLAEQALRKLAAAAKSGAARLEKKRSDARLESRRAGLAAGSRRVRPSEDAFMDALKDLGSLEESVEQHRLDGATDVDEVISLSATRGVLVNHDVGHWRRGTAGFGR